MQKFDSSGYHLFVDQNRVYYTKGNSWYCFDGNKSWEINRNSYLHIKFGHTKGYSSFIDHRCDQLSNGNLITIDYQENTLRLHKSESAIVLDKIKPYFDFPIYDVAVDADDYIWIVSPSAHFVGQFDLDGALLFSIGCDSQFNPTLFDHPQSITCKDDLLYISDMGHQCVASINTQTKNILSYKEINEPIFEYLRSDEHEYFVLKSGLYFQALTK